MDKPNLSTYRTVVPLIYSWSTPDVPKYDGWEKIGGTNRANAEERIAEQASQMSIEKKINWVLRAFFTSPEGGSFTDYQFHDYLKKQGVERELEPKRTEWHKFADQPKGSQQHFYEFASQQVVPDSTAIEEDYVLRPEQEGAVEQTLEAFADGYDEMLWNAKPRFGKTLTAYDLMRRMEAEKVLIVTNRPAIANSWFDDFSRFIGHQTRYHFISESNSLAERNPMSREQFTKYRLGRVGEDVRRIEFVSLQDLKGSERFGGKYDKNKYISELDWDLLIIDEAHEGVNTLKTDVAFDQIKRNKTLHLSGTPFKALAEGKFSKEQIYNWTYEDEQEAKCDWDDPFEDNPYEPLPTLNLYTYQMSRMIEDQLDTGVAASDDPEAENIDFAFNLNEFFATKDNGFFEHEADVIKFLDRLSENEKYPFSTPELRDEIRHSFWLLERVASAKALKKLLNSHPVFRDYEVILAAGDRRDDGDTEKVGKALDEVKNAIKTAEATDGKTITLSVGQLTTGVTIPEWTAVMMLSNIKSPALYMQSAFRAQNPCTFERGGNVFEKQNAYVFDFSPERTLITFDEFANNLSPVQSSDPLKRQENIATLLNFFPVIGEDSEGKMTLLDAEQVLTFPQAFKAREVVRRGFMSNLLFDNIAGIFRHAEHYKEILEKLPTAKQGKIRKDGEIEIPEPIPNVDDYGIATADEIVINRQAKKLGKTVWEYEDLSDIEPETPTAALARQVAARVSEKTRETRENARKEYGLSKRRTEADDRRTRRIIENEVKRVKMNHDIAIKRIEDEIKEAPTQAAADELEAKKAATREELKEDIFTIVEEITEPLPEQLATREENKKSQKQADKTMEETRAHLRGFARTIPMFIMAYGNRDLKLSNFEDYTPDHVFKEVTGITEEEFRFLRDGREVIEEDGTTKQIPGLFNAGVFDQSVQEFLDKKEQLADYFDPDLTEDIFAYIPQQKTSLVFTPEPVVKQMVDILEKENPGIFTDPNKTFADLFSTAGLFLMEIVRRLDAGLKDQIPDQQERLHHIFTSQIYEMAHNELLHHITVEAVSGGVEQRKQWMEQSGHFRFGDITEMTEEELQETVDDMLSEEDNNE